MFCMGRDLNPTLGALIGPKGIGKVSAGNLEFKHGRHSYTLPAILFNSRSISSKVVSCSRRQNAPDQLSGLSFDLFNFSHKQTLDYLIILKQNR